MSTDVNFDQAAYWRKRHEELRGDPRSVGTLALSKAENVAGEENLLRLMGQILPTIDAPRSILDVGCGYGRLASTFIDAGFLYHGIDVSSVAIEQARQRNISAEFEVADLAAWDTAERFGVVFVAWVFVHFVDDQDWRSIVSRCISWIAPGGVLLFADFVPAIRDAKVRHAVSRPLSDYIEIFDREGMAIDTHWRESIAAHVPQNSLLPQFYVVRRRIGRGAKIS